MADTKYLNESHSRSSQTHQHSEIIQPPHQQQRDTQHRDTHVYNPSSTGRGERIHSYQSYLPVDIRQRNRYNDTSTPVKSSLIYSRQPILYQSDAPVMNTFELQQVTLYTPFH